MAHIDRRLVVSRSHRQLGNCYAVLAQFRPILVFSLSRGLNNYAAAGDNLGLEGQAPY